MNIWILNHYAHPPDLPGATRHYELAKDLAKCEHQVTIIATSFHHYLHKETRLQPGENWKVEDLGSSQFVWIRTPPYQQNDRQRVRNMIMFMVRAIRLSRKLPDLVPKIGKPDVVIGYSPHLLTPLAACWIAYRFHVPFVIEIADLWPQTIIDMGEFNSSHPVIKSLQALEKFLYQKADCIITLLPFAHNYITACGIPSEKVIWIPTGVDLSRFTEDTHELANHEFFQVMYLGAHGQANALDVTIEAAKIVKEMGFGEIHFVFMGDGPEKTKLIALAKEFGLTNVEFRDPVPKKDVHNALREADAFLFNLEDVAVFKYGISPNKLFDYMITGKPVITSVEAKGNPVEKARCGLIVPPRDPKALAEALIKIYRMSPDEREEMGHRGQEYVKEHHDISKLAGLLEHTLTEVIEYRR